MSPLRRGRTQARDPPPTLPVSASVVAATLVHLSGGSAGLVRFQWWTGCRPGEAVAATADAFVRRDGTLVYAPTQHKTLHHGHARNIVLGPRAAADLGPLPAAGHLFRNTLGKPYTVRAYRKAVVAASRRAGVEHWHPHQLRHAAATRMVEHAGLEAARIMLGHRTISATEMYVARELGAAIDLAKKYA